MRASQRKTKKTDFFVGDDVQALAMVATPTKKRVAKVKSESENEDENVLMLLMPMMINA